MPADAVEVDPCRVDAVFDGVGLCECLGGGVHVATQAGGECQESVAVTRPVIVLGLDGEFQRLGGVADGVAEAAE